MHCSVFHKDASSCPPLVRNVHVNRHSRINPRVSLPTLSVCVTASLHFVRTLRTHSTLIMFFNYGDFRAIGRTAFSSSMF